MPNEIVYIAALSIAVLGCSVAAFLGCRKKQREARSACLVIAVFGSILVVGSALLPADLGLHTYANMQARREIERGVVIREWADADGTGFEVEFPDAGPGEATWMRTTITRWRPVWWVPYAIGVPFALFVGVGAWISTGSQVIERD